MRIQQAALADEWLGGLRVRSLIRGEQQTLKAYVASVAWDQWASPAEMAAAAEVVNIKIGLAAETYVTLNAAANKRESPYMLVLREQHYMLWKK